jgi:hypothetical protein
LSTVTVPKALLELGRLLVQGRGALVGGKLMRLGSRSAVSYSHHPVRFVHRRPPIREWLFSLRQPPGHEQGEGCLQHH